jgi:hypothetical protein
LKKCACKQQQKIVKTFQAKSCAGTVNNINAAQAVQNYHANLQVLEDCETDEQKETCKVICDNMYQMAVKEIDGLKNEQQTMNAQSQKFCNTIQEDIQTLRQRQLALQQLQQGLTPTGTRINKNKAKLFEGANQDVKDGDSKGTSPLDRVAMQQEEHLDTMAKHLNELGSIAGHLNFLLAKHSDTLDALDEKNDSMLLKTKNGNSSCRPINSKKEIMGKGKGRVCLQCIHPSSAHREIPFCGTQ